MKALNTKLVILLASITMLGVGCSKKSSSLETSTDTAVTPAVASPTGSGTGTTVTSNKVQFYPVSLAEMNSYVGNRPLNNPTNIALTVSMSDKGSYRFGGTVNITYIDNGINYNGVFQSCLTSNCINPNISPSYGTARDVGVSEVAYNYWFMNNNKKVFTGYFQDKYGAIILVIDNVVNQGDGQGSATVSGEVWYMNFSQQFSTQSTLRQCWFIYAGPYDCRSDIANTKSSVYPTDKFRKLGTFTGLTLTGN